MAGSEKVVKQCLQAMQHIYGQFDLVQADDLSSWIPPPMIEGHRGRYLWTDGFGVLNFITLSREMKDEKYLTLAGRLVTNVRDVLGRTRDGLTRLPGASDAKPLNGGLRIGKEEETGSDGDGQYFHYLTIWMFALNRMSIATKNKAYNLQAIELAKAIHPRFMYNRSSNRPRMFWKMSMDLSNPLVHSEGHLDPIDGYVMYSILQRTSGDPSVLAEEISDYKKILDTKWQLYQSSDPLDLGMTLWTAHWFKGEEEWADAMTEGAFGDLITLDDSEQYFNEPTSYRLAFREFGTCLGIQCHDRAPKILKDLRQKIISTWEEVGSVPVPSKPLSGEKALLVPITLVMYCAAICPGAFRKDYFSEEI